MKAIRRHRNRIRFIAIAALTALTILVGRVAYVAVFQSARLSAAAKELHERERAIKAPRGRIISSDGTVLADNETVCTVSVVHSQIKDSEKVIKILSEELMMSEEKVRKYVEKFSSMERVKTNVDKATGDRIRAYGLEGVKVDEDRKEYIPTTPLHLRFSVLRVRIIRELWDLKLNMRI